MPFQIENLRSIFVHLFLFTLFLLIGCRNIDTSHETSGRDADSRARIDVVLVFGKHLSDQEGHLSLETQGTAGSLGYATHNRSIVSDAALIQNMQNACKVDSLVSVWLYVREQSDGDFQSLTGVDRAVTRIVAAFEAASTAQHQLRLQVIVRDYNPQTR